jgi:hypothetical protein
VLISEEPTFITKQKNNTFRTKKRRRRYTLSWRTCFSTLKRCFLSTLSRKDTTILVDGAELRLYY